MHMSWETQIWCSLFVLIFILLFVYCRFSNSIHMETLSEKVRTEQYTSMTSWLKTDGTIATNCARLTTDHIISKLRVVRPSLRPLFFSWQVAIMEKVTKNPRPSPNRQSVSSIVERRVIKSTLCVASLTGSLVSKDLAYSRVIPCKYKRDDWDRQGDKWG